MTQAEAKPGSRRPNHGSAAGREWRGLGLSAEPDVDGGADASVRSPLLRSQCPVKPTPSISGAALPCVTIFINHVPGLFYERLTHRTTFSISDSAEMFVFLAG